MKRYYLILSVLGILAAISCNFISGVQDDDEDFFADEPEAGTTESLPTGGDDFEDEEPIPEIESDQLFLREFSFELPLFAPDSAWNQRVDKAAVLPGSDAQILSLYRVLLGDIRTLEGYDEPAVEWPYIDISLYDYTVPIFPTGSGTQDVYICEDEGIVGWVHPIFGIESEGGPVTVPAPASLVRPAGPENSDADAWLVLYDSSSFRAYDYFAASPDRDEACMSFEGGRVGEKIFQAGVVDYFDIRGDGASPDGYYSARAVGTPLLAGLLLPEDVESGEIAHALSFAIPGPRNTGRDPSEPLVTDYFYPASTTETDFYNTDPNSLAAGQRIRLKQEIVDDEGIVINEGELAPITQMFLATLRTYGAYLVDNAGGFTFYAEDVHTANLHLTDDEVNALIGEPMGTPLPEGMTKWQVVIEKLGEEVTLFPFATSLGDDEPDPEDAEILIANFEVVEQARKP